MSGSNNMSAGSAGELPSVSTLISTGLVSLSGVTEGCSICLEAPMPNPVSVPCPANHVFCAFCIVEWLSSARTCPMCRERLCADPPPSLVRGANNRARPRPPSLASRTSGNGNGNNNGGPSTDNNQQGATENNGQGERQSISPGRNGWPPLADMLSQHDRDSGRREAFSDPDALARMFTQDARDTLPSQRRNQDPNGSNEAPTLVRGAPNRARPRPSMESENEGQESGYFSNYATQSRQSRVPGQTTSRRPSTSEVPGQYPNTRPPRSFRTHMQERGYFADYATRSRQLRDSRLTPPHSSRPLGAYPRDGGDSPQLGGYTESGGYSSPVAYPRDGGDSPQVGGYTGSGGYSITTGEYTRNYNNYPTPPAGYNGGSPVQTRRSGRDDRGRAPVTPPTPDTPSRRPTTPELVASAARTRQRFADRYFGTPTNSGLGSRLAGSSRNQDNSQSRPADTSRSRNTDNPQSRRERPRRDRYGNPD